MLVLSFSSTPKGVEFLGEMKFSDLFSYVDARRPLFYHEGEVEGENQHNPYTTDEMGTVVSVDNISNNTGEIEFGPCDRYYCTKVSSKDDLSHDEIEAIRKYPVIWPELTALIRVPKNSVCDFESFAQFLNDTDDYPVAEAEEIIERNGWELCEDDSEVCRFGGKKIERNERGKFEVVYEQI